MRHNTPNPTIAIVVAAGRGLRAGGDVAKQWQYLNDDLRVIDVTVDALLNHPRIDEVVVVVSADALNDANLPDGVRVTVGGSTRMQSVRNGLKAISALNPENVLIHDAARPCLSAELIDGIVDALVHHDGAIPACAVTDALFIEDAGYVGDPVDRTPLRRAQTPQGFRFTPLLQAFEAADPNAPDDAAVAKAEGLKISVVPGQEDNIKITHPEDFDRARRILGFR